MVSQVLQARTSTSMHQWIKNSPLFFVNVSNQSIQTNQLQLQTNQLIQNDPDTPKWPDPVKDIVNKDDVTRTVKYVYEDGSKAKEDVSETLHFKRFAYVNLVTGHIDYRPWTTTDDTFDAVTSPVIKGLHSR